MFKVPDESFNGEDMIVPTYFCKRDKPTSASQDNQNSASQNKQTSVSPDDASTAQNKPGTPTSVPPNKPSDVSSNTPTTSVSPNNPTMSPHKISDNSAKPAATNLTSLIFGSQERLAGTSTNTAINVSPEVSTNACTHASPSLSSRICPNPPATVLSPDVFDRRSRRSRKTFAEAFASIRDREIDEEAEISIVLEENRKRKMEKTPEYSGADLNSSVLVVSARQRGNPLLSHIRNVALTYSDAILPDYIMGNGICALFLSLKYHRLHPDYIYDRLRQLGSGFKVRVLLLLVDIPDSAACVQELTKAALLSNCTLYLSWSSVEAARYLEAFKIYENKPPEVLQGFKDNTYQGQLNRFLTTIKGVNKTDALRLKEEFGTVRDICRSEKAQLAALPGIGAKKATRTYDLFRMPFKTQPPPELP